MKKCLFVLCCFVFVFDKGLCAQSIQEKITNLREVPPEMPADIKEELGKTNAEMKQRQVLLKKLRKLYKQVPLLYKGKAAEDKYKELLGQINKLRKEIRDIEVNWQLKSSKTISAGTYGILHRVNTTLLDLTIDYGSLSYVYLIPPEVGKIQVSVSSDLPLPRGSWEETLEQIFMANGVGVRQITPYLKSLYLLDKNPQGFYMITDKKRDLSVVPADKRLCFILPVEYGSASELVTALKGFINAKNSFIQAIDRQLFIVATASDVKQLLRIYDFIKQNREGKNVKVLTLTKMEAKDMSDFLNQQLFVTSSFSTTGASAKKPPSRTGASSLQIATFPNLTHSLFLSGSKEEVAKIEDIVREIEGQITDSQQETIQLYHCKHSTSEELAKTLRGVYAAILNKAFSTAAAKASALSRLRNPTTKPIKAADVEGNFIVDEKTNSIVMIIEERALTELTDILKKLDKPKKMVKIDVLLFEKNINDGNEFGLNMLNVGKSTSKNEYGSGFGFSAGNKDSSASSWIPSFYGTKGGSFWQQAGGLTGFFLSQKKAGILPAFDAAYSFLITQEDTKLISSPSVTTINQTAAKIEVKTETSISTGINYIDSGGATKTPQASYKREKYGIEIDLTPTIHVGDVVIDLDEKDDFVTLKTEIKFDTLGSQKVENQPDFYQRRVINEVTIADGQTVIIGGLRQNENAKTRATMPFLGEIPFVGKLFGHTTYEDRSKEMFVCLTPHIINDPARDFEKLKQEELRRRPGDVPEFVRAVEQARKADKKRLFIQGFRGLFGTAPRNVMKEEEYDGVR